MTSVPAFERKRITARILFSFVVFSIVLAAVGILGSNSGATDRNGPVAPTFQFTCATTEMEFYDWIETTLWNKKRKFRRNLDGAIDALVSNPQWTIVLTKEECPSGLITPRREALYFMIDDAHAEGAGEIL